MAQLRETAPDGDEWDWKGRVEVDEEADVDEEDDEMDEINRLAEEDKKAVDGPRAVWSVQQAARYARTGRLPI